MDIDEAKRLVAGRPPLTLLADIKAALAARHGSAPQRAKLAEFAMEEIEHGLAELAKLGERFHLVQLEEEAPLPDDESEEPEPEPEPVTSRGSAVVSPAVTSRTVSSGGSTSSTAPTSSGSSVTSGGTTSGKAS